MRDQEIIRLLLERDERGIDELMKQYGSLIRYIIRPIVPDSGEIPQDTPSGGMTPDEEVIQRERQAKLEAAIRSLSGTDKILFYRRYYYMQSVKQISAETGMTLKSVESRLYRLKQRLKDEMGR